MINIPNYLSKHSYWYNKDIVDSIGYKILLIAMMAWYDNDDNRYNRDNDLCYNEINNYIYDMAGRMINEKGKNIVLFLNWLKFTIVDLKYNND